MPISAWGFPQPITKEQIKTGDLFLLRRSGTERWLLLAMYDHINKEDCYLVLGAPETGEPIPRFLTLSAISGTSAHLSGLSVVAEPLPDVGIPLPEDERKNGALLIDAAGKPWIWVYLGLQTQNAVSLETGHSGAPKMPFSSFSKWRSVVVDGERRIEIAKLDA